MTTDQIEAARVLETPRLILRAPTQADGPGMATLVDDPGVARMTTSIPHPYPRETIGDFIAARLADDPERSAFFAIEARKGAFAGALGFSPAARGAVEIGYWLGRAYWGHGLMTEAVEAALAWAAGPWRKRVIVAGHFADNPASGHVLVKAGFLYTGEVIRKFSVARGEETPTRMMVWLA